MNWIEKARQRAVERQAAGLLRYSYDAKGLILRLEHGVVVCPYEQTRAGWYAVVVWAPESSSYPRGGYNILVGDDDIERAPEVEILL